MIGPDNGPRLPGAAFLTCSNVSSLLGNSYGLGKYMHPYGLVILDACNSFSSGWADAFGIARLSMSQTQYAKYNLQAQAFVGWPVKVPCYTLTYAGNGVAAAPVIQAWGTAEGTLQSLWMLGYPLNYCVGQFAASLNNWGPPYSENVVLPIWPLNHYAHPSQRLQLLPNLRGLRLDIDRPVLKYQIMNDRYKTWWAGLVLCLLWLLLTVFDVDLSPTVHGRLVYLLYGCFAILVGISVAAYRWDRMGARERTLWGWAYAILAFGIVFWAFSHDGAVSASDRLSRERPALTAH